MCLHKRVQKKFFQWQELLAYSRASQKLVQNPMFSFFYPCDILQRCFLLG